jgi:hypothetical protein
MSRLKPRPTRLFSGVVENLRQEHGAKDIMSDWPKHGHSLRNPGVDPRSEALLGVYADWIISYASSFKEAADVVVGAVESKSVSPDAVGYAVCNLYRNCIELMLKGLIRLDYQLEETPNDFPSSGRDGHDLTKLWRTTRDLLERLFPEGDKSETGVVEKCVQEMVDIDGGVAQRSRWGEDSKGNDLWPQCVQLDLPNLRDVMNGVFGFLSGSYDVMDRYLQCQQDIDSELEE